MISLAHFEWGVGTGGGEMTVFGVRGYERVGGWGAPSRIMTIYNERARSRLGRLVILHCLYLLIDLFDDSVKKNTSTQRPNFDAFLLTNQSVQPPKLITHGES